MKYTLILLVLWSLPASGQTLSFSIKESRLVYNNSVGNEWGTGVYITYQGREYEVPKRSSVTLKVEPGSSLSIKAVAQEYDKYTDTGSTIKELSLRDITAHLPYIVELAVTVRENRGRYAGNTAKWKFVVRIEQEG